MIDMALYAIGVGAFALVILCVGAYLDRSLDLRESSCSRGFSMASSLLAPGGLLFGAYVYFVLLRAGKAIAGRLGGRCWRRQVEWSLSPQNPSSAESSPYWQAARQVYITMRQVGAKNPLAIAAVRQRRHGERFPYRYYGGTISALSTYSSGTLTEPTALPRNTGIDVKSETVDPRELSRVCGGRSLT